MADRLILEIEFPGFNVEETRESAKMIAGNEGREAIDEALDEAMNASDEVIVVFLYHGDRSDPNGLKALEGRVRLRRLQ